MRRPTIVVLSPKACALLTDVIDMHVEGVLESKGLTTDDPTIETAEELLDLMSGYDYDLELLNIIRKKVNKHGRSS